MTTTLPAAKQSASSPAHRDPARDPGPVRNPTGAPEQRRLLDRLTLTDLRLHLFTRLGLWLVAYCTAWLSPAGSDARTSAPWLSRWEQ
ncbi:hypothetical protein [Streptomyces sp. NBC_00057]|uniref:hypothetical protein n=1 Tax=Streptomyces sp. NBC_00057 TaxID=2975634 RepID=UPI003243DA3F